MAECRITDGKNRYCKNTSGVKAIYIANYPETTNKYNFLTFGEQGQITDISGLTTQLDFYPFITDDKISSFEESYENNLFTQKINIFIHNLNQQNQNLIKDLLQGYFIIIVKLKTNDYFMFGIEDSMSVISGEATAEKNAYEILIQAEEQDPAPYVESSALIMDPVVADFTYTLYEKTATFTNTSQNAIYSKWDFGDGNISYEENPTHTYTDSGNYFIVLTSYNISSIDQKIDEIKMEPPIADFIYYFGDDRDAIFPNRSISANTYLWDFGDGTTSTETTPIHIYAGAGDYDVSLTAYNYYGATVIIKTITIIYYNIQLTLRTTTYNQTIGIPITDNVDVVILWGDETTSSHTTDNPTHEYTTAGDYNVKVYINTADNFDYINNTTYRTNIIKYDGMIHVWDFINFFSCSNITNIKNVRTTQSDMRSMFSSINSILDLDLTSLETSTATDMRYMFISIPLPTIDVSNFDTSNVTNMSYMFASYYFETLDLSNLDTSNVTNMYAMFYNDQHLTTLDVSNFDTSNVTNMSFMFAACNNLTILDVNHFNTEKATDISSMFLRCRFTKLNLSTWITTSATTSRSMFYDCINLTSLNLSNFDTSNITDMSFMFNYAGDNLCITANNNFTTTHSPTNTNMFIGSDIINPTSTQQTALVSAAGATYNFSCLQADFTYVDYGKEITFTNISTGATNYLWDFGDGDTSTTTNPVHTYSAYSGYTITLTAYDGTDTDIHTETIETTIIPPELLGFDYYSDSYQDINESDAFIVHTKEIKIKIDNYQYFVDEAITLYYELRYYNRDCSTYTPTYHTLSGTISSNIKTFNLIASTPGSNENHINYLKITNNKTSDEIREWDDTKEITKYEWYDTDAVNINGTHFPKTTYGNSSPYPTFSSPVSITLNKSLDCGWEHGGFGDVDGDVYRIIVRANSSVSDDTGWVSAQPTQLNFIYGSRVYDIECQIRNKWFTTITQMVHINYTS